MAKYTLQDFIDGKVIIKYTSGDNKERLEKILESAFPGSMYLVFSVACKYYGRGTNSWAGSNYINDFDCQKTCSVNDIILPGETALSKLPEFFCVKCDLDHPLWWVYIHWLNKTYGCSFKGGATTLYYGVFKDSSHANARYSNMDTRRITLEQWSSIVGIQAPEFKVGDRVMIEQNDDQELFGHVGEITTVIKPTKETLPNSINVDIAHNTEGGLNVRTINLKLMDNNKGKAYMWATPALKKAFTKAANMLLNNIGHMLRKGKYPILEEDQSVIHQLKKAKVFDLWFTAQEIDKKEKVFCIKGYGTTSFKFIVSTDGILIKEYGRYVDVKQLEKVVSMSRTVTMYKDPNSTGSKHDHSDYGVIAGPKTITLGNSDSFLVDDIKEALGYYRTIK
jgi:hypothetical protein